MNITLSTQTKVNPDGQEYQPIKIEEADATAMTQALAEAATAKTNIDNGSKAHYQDLAKEFGDFMSNQVSPQFKDKVAPALGLFANISPDLKENKREKKRNAALTKFLKQCFTKSTDLILHKNDQWPKENSASKVYALVKTIFTTLYFAQNDPEVARILQSVGLEIKFNYPLDDISDGEEGSQGLRDSRDQIINEGVSALKETVEQNLAIEETLYPKVPAALRYDAESNPKGIKKGQFTSMAATEAKKQQLESDGEVDKAKELIQKTSEKFFYGSVNQQLLFDTYQQVQ